MRRPGRALPMQKVREVLRLWSLGFNQSEIARGARTSRGTVRDYIRIAEAAELSAAAAEELNDDALRELFGKKPGGRPKAAPDPDFASISEQLCRKGVTRQLLWREYLREHPGAMSYAQYCKSYARWQQRQKYSLRREHKAGERAEVDYAGMTVPVYLPNGCVQAQIFVGCLCASNFTFAEATPSQRAECWLMSHVRMFEFFGGVPESVGIDNLRSGVTSPCRYEPGVNRSYEELARHYGVAVLPSRVRKPRDKAKVEVAVQLVERHILAPLRDKHFETFAELNEAITKLLSDLNDRKMKLYGCSRRELFCRHEQEALKSLPTQRFAVGQWKTARVNIDYHIEIQRHYYSVPFQLIGELVEVRTSERTVELYHNHQRVALHRRSAVVGGHTTNEAHRPEAHRAVASWTPQRLIDWASKFGSEVTRQVDGLLAARDHPHQAYRSILGILRLGERVGAATLNRACTRANDAGVFSYQRIKELVAAEEHENVSSPVHAHLRGSEYYH